MIKTNSSQHQKAVCVLAELSQDEEERLLAESREKAYRDWQASMESSFNEGKIEEKIKGVIMLVSKYNVPLNSAMFDFSLDENYKSQIIDELNERNVKYNE